MSGASSFGSRRKICIKCNADVSSAKRFKDAAGNYYCQACFAIEQARYVAAQAASGVVGDAASALPPDHATARSLGLLPAITCPHCWHQFPPAGIKWVAHHSDLVNDSVLGPEKPKRFTPSRFTPDGQAIDERGTPCQSLACPRCHLIIPRSVIELEPMFLSVVGGPTSGKSYFLASMSWELRRQMPSDFGLSFSDADAEANMLLMDYERTLFLRPDPDELVIIQKTGVQNDAHTGNLYDEVNIGGQIMNLPRPFLFNIRPTSAHPKTASRNQYSRLMCVYDNAGEHFQPGMDTPGSPVTLHLARSRAIMFLFDPTQDPRFRDQCRSLSNDPQLGSSSRTQRQETLLVEASLRVRRHTNLGSNSKHQAPLIMIIPKSDVWSGLLPGEDLVSDPLVPQAINNRLSTLDVARVERVSAKLRTLLDRWCPEVVAAAEDFCQHVIYIPVSALGCSPEPKSGVTGLYVRPRLIKPRWATVPVTYMLAKWASGLIAQAKRL